VTFLDLINFIYALSSLRRAAVRKISAKQEVNAFGGVIFAKQDNPNVNSIYDLRDK
jgi:hypothetical protein